MDKSDIARIWLTDEGVHILTVDGREGMERFDDYTRLRYASADERSRYEVWGEGIHWPLLDEDLCFEGFFDKKPDTPLFLFFKAHPELDASAFARRLRVPQQTFAQYITGEKPLPPTLREELLTTIHELSHELHEATI